MFFLLHFCYGIGTLVGLVRIPFWKHSLKKRAKETGFNARDEIEKVRLSVIENSAAKADDKAEDKTDNKEEAEE